MELGKIDIREFHWMMGMLQNIDVGLAVIDRDYRIQLWNSFMENHSGVAPANAIGRGLFEVCGEIPEGWFRRKAESVFLLNNRAFCIWEQRPFVFRFKNYRPITGAAPCMYQNITLIPLASADGVVNHVGIIVYDVTDTAVGKQELESANEQLEELSRTDRLTQLFNRGYWEACLEQEFNRFKRTGAPNALVMFDIDHFKRVNDTYGHQAGDEVIRVTAATLRATARATDIAGRYGGEEFGVILINTDAERGMIFAERLRKRIEGASVESEAGTIRWTISLGITEFRSDMTSHEPLIGAADEALYAAKEGGRNRAVIHRPED